jgi:hypothetical protein
MKLTIAPCPEGFGPMSYQDQLAAYLDALASIGYIPSHVNNGDGYEVTLDRAAVLSEALSCDEAHIRFHARANEKRAWVYIVLGNSPSELMSDYGIVSDEFDKALEAVSDALEHRTNLYTA